MNPHQHDATRPTNSGSGSGSTGPDAGRPRAHHRDAGEGLPTALVVAEIHDISATMRRVRFAGTGVADYLRAPRIPNIKLLFPHEGAPLELPGPGEDHHYSFAPGQRERVRTYTVRSFDKDASTLDIDFVRHGRDGLASSWVEDAAPGDSIGALGGGGRLPAPCDWLLLVADDTALPAAAGILEQLPPDQQGLALLEVDGAEDHIPLSRPAGLEVRWLHRRGTHPATSDLLVEEALGIPLPASLEKVFVWASAESHVVRAVRQHVRSLGVPRHNQLIIGYWHAGSAEPTYARTAHNDRVADESSVCLPEVGDLRADAVARLLAGGRP